MKNVTMSFVYELVQKILFSWYCVIVLSLYFSTDVAVLINRIVIDDSKTDSSKSIYSYTSILVRDT